MEDDTSRSQHAAAAGIPAFGDPGGALAISGVAAPGPRAAVGNGHVASIVAPAVVAATAATPVGGLASEDLECPVCLSVLQVGMPTETSLTTQLQAY